MQPRMTMGQHDCLHEHGVTRRRHGPGMMLAISRKTMTTPMTTMSLNHCG